MNYKSSKILHTKQNKTKKIRHTSTSTHMYLESTYTQNIRSVKKIRLEAKGEI